MMEGRREGGRIERGREKEKNRRIDKRREGDRRRKEGGREDMRIMVSPYSKYFL